MEEADGTKESGIDAAVAHWRAEVRHLEDAELDELADHVASSARTLLASGLNSEEAVCIAARRLGAERELVREFERGDGRTRSFDPLALVALGAAGALFVTPLAKVYVMVVFAAAHYFGLGESEWSSAVVALAIVAPLALWIPLSRWKGAAGIVQRVSRWPATTLAIAMLLLFVPFTAQLVFSRLFSPDVYLPMFFVNWPVVLAFVLPGFLAPIALLALGLRRTRAASAAGTESA